MTKPIKQSAVDKLQRSQLSQKSVQAELMGDDLDLEKLLIYLKGKIQFDSVDLVKDIVVTRTVEGASTVVVTLIDPKRDVLRLLPSLGAFDIQLDGLWFRLVKVEKQDDNLMLTFEDREIAILRTYKKLKIAHRSKVTRAEFVLNLIREVKEEKIPVVIPELHKVQPIAKSKDLPSAASVVADKTGGIPETYANAQDQHRHGEQKATSALRPSLTVKKFAADVDQIRNANIILQVGQTMGARRKVLVCAIMTAIQESTLRNLPYGDEAGPDSLGLFQQRDSWGSRDSRLDPATAARLFFNRAIPYDKEFPTSRYEDVCQGVQHSKFPTAYAQWRAEGERFVSAYGIVGTDNEGSASDANLMNALPTEGSNYIFYRGLPQSGGKKWKKEDSWICIQRLAAEVAWRAFFVSGVFYYITEEDLFKSKPIADVGEFDDGVEGINGDYDQGKKNATVTVTARVGTWLVPPGAIITLHDMGTFDGRWLVNTFQRSIFDSKATITLKKPQPILSEPIQNDINQIPTWAAPQSGAMLDSPGTSAAFGGTIDPAIQGSRAGIVEICRQALLAQQAKPYHYLQKRPMPDTLWSDEAHDGIDCSSFATLVYKEAGCDDPNDFNYNGSGFTGSLIARGVSVVTPQPGDLVFYLGDGTTAAPGHVAVYVGLGEVVEIGSNAGISQLPVNYRKDLIGYKSYLPLVTG